MSHDVMLRPATAVVKEGVRQRACSGWRLLGENRRESRLPGRAPLRTQQSPGVFRGHRLTEQVTLEKITTNGKQTGQLVHRLYSFSDNLKTKSLHQVSNGFNNDQSVPCLAQPLDEAAVDLDVVDGQQ